MSGPERQRQYETMRRAAVLRLYGTDPLERAAACGVRFLREREAFAFSTFGEAVLLSAGDWSLEPPLDMWRHLTILQYFAGASGERPNGSWISLGELEKGEASRGASFDREIDRLLGEGLRGLSQGSLRRRCEALGARIREDTPADLTADFFFMPEYPLRLNLWLPDEEFPASGKVLADSGVRQVLGLEAAGTLAVGLVQRLLEKGEPFPHRRERD